MLKRHRQTAKSRYRVDLDLKRSELPSGQYHDDLWAQWQRKKHEQERWTWTMFASQSIHAAPLSAASHLTSVFIPSFPDHHPLLAAELLFLEGPHSLQPIETSLPTASNFQVMLSKLRHLDPPTELVLKLTSVARMYEPLPLIYILCLVMLAKQPHTEEVKSAFASLQDHVVSIGPKWNFAREGLMEKHASLLRRCLNPLRLSTDTNPTTTLALVSRRVPADCTLLRMGR